MQQALFGGSFDPPHVGHVLATHYVLLTASVERVLIVPCGEHAFGKGHASFADRLAMCRLAFAHLGSAAEVLDIEGKRPGPSYTIDTVREILQERPDTDLTLVMGSDLQEELKNWKESAELLRLVKVLTLPRLEENTASVESAQETPYYLPRVSSSALRVLLAQDDDADIVRASLPQAVLEYLQERKLYRCFSSQRNVK